MKLSRKYGDTVRLLVVSVDTTLSAPQKRRLAEVANRSDEADTEQQYELTQEERGSNDISLLSRRFNPYKALHAQQETSEIVLIKDAPILDNISKARYLLPSDDPLYFVPPNAGKVYAKREMNAAKSDKPKKLPMFATIAISHEHGPLSILFECLIKRRRIRILVRYVNCIRGTLTGFLKGMCIPRLNSFPHTMMHIFYFPDVST